MLNFTKLTKNQLKLFIDELFFYVSRYLSEYDLYCIQHELPVRDQLGVGKIWEESSDLLYRVEQLSKILNRRDATRTITIIDYYKDFPNRHLTMGDSVEFLKYETQKHLLKDYIPETFEFKVSNESKQLALHIYNSSEFHLMPILGDSLEDLGNSDKILEHCKSWIPHKRGCWVLNQILKGTI